MQSEFFLDGIIMIDSELIRRINDMSILEASLAKYPEEYKHLAAANLVNFLLSLQNK